MGRNGNSSKYTHLIWDWNGTLQNDAWLCLEVINGLLEKRHKAPLTLPSYREIFGFPVRDYYEKAGFDFQIESYETLAAEYIAEYDRRSSACDLQPQAVEVLKFCVERDFSQYVLSASQQNPLDMNIAHYGLGKFFCEVVGLSDYYGQGKVENGRALVAQLNVPADCIVLIGDTKHDYEVAQAIGIDCILFSGGHQSKERLVECGTIVVENLNDLRSILD